jgi:hypothetical protein
LARAGSASLKPIVIAGHFSAGTGSWFSVSWSPSNASITPFVLWLLVAAFGVGCRPRRLASESIRNCAEATTCCPACRPLRTTS